MILFKEKELFTLASMASFLKIKSQPDSFHNQSCISFVHINIDIYTSLSHQQQQQKHDCTTLDILTIQCVQYTLNKSYKNISIRKQT